ncbi:hydroxymyristoyl-ACP dehydratase [Aquabacterium sp.]|uniref:hydroxymyristoyl-ACP dehydratase n=1 Tax=Aquabacterium sp. TaxID=1872578 RepID=UPI0035B3FE6D
MIHDRNWIAARIPHQGSMCLLDGVLACDADHIVCTATSHRDPANPLRRAGTLGITNGIEYAAQAMAAHGASLHPNAPGRSGYLTSARDVAWQVPHLHDIAGPLTVRAQRQSGDDNTVLYAFSLHAGERVLMTGRTTVILNADNHAF